MVIGISSAKPPPGDIKKPTITAVFQSIDIDCEINKEDYKLQLTASMDAHPWRYRTSVRLQYGHRSVDAQSGQITEVRHDYVANLGEMVRHFLRLFVLY